MAKGGADRRLLKKKGKKLARLATTMIIARRVLIMRGGGRRYSGCGARPTRRRSLCARLSISRAALIGIGISRL